MQFTYFPKGVCSTKIDLEIEDGIVRHVHFTGGCDGNLKAVSALIEGMKVEDVQKRLSGIHCGLKSTSCADQLARGLAQALKEA